jgi:hypothetical protein
VSDLRTVLLDAVRDVIEEREPRPTGELLTTEELAKVIKVSPDTARKRRRQGCPHVAVGEKKLRWRLSSRQLRVNTLDALARLWKRDKADKDMRSLERAYGQYHQHISPRLGKREPDSVRPREVLAVLWDAYERDEAKRRALGKLGAKSVHNLKATLSSIYSFGVFEELVEVNVCRAVARHPQRARRHPRRLHRRGRHLARALRGGAVFEGTVAARQRAAATACRECRLGQTHGQTGTRN